MPRPKIVKVKPGPVCALQESEIAWVYRTRDKRWQYTPRRDHYPRLYSERFKTEKEALQAAFSRGFGKVQLLGRIILRPEPEEPVLADPEPEVTPEEKTEKSF